MKEWIGEKADEWTAGIKRVINGIGGEFSEVEAALTEVFLPALFGETTPAGVHLRKITALPVKVSGLSILNAEHSATKNYSTLVDCCSFLVNAIMGRATWSHLDHKVTLKQAREAAQLTSVKDAEITRTKLTGEGSMSKKDARIIGRG
eukprot:scaffold340478_cov42-Attheya_sp.AAC.1